MVIMISAEEWAERIRKLVEEEGQAWDLFDCGEEHPEGRWQVARREGYEPAFKDDREARKHVRRSSRLSTSKAAVAVLAFLSYHNKAEWYRIIGGG